MKNKLFIPIVILSFIVPRITFAYDAITPNETDQAIANNANFLLKEEYERYCKTEPLRVEKEIGEIKQKDIKEYIKIQETEPLYKLLQEFSNTCTEVTKKITNQTLPTPEKNKNLGCGSNYIKRGGICITSTEACRIYFGYNVTGTKSLNDASVAECTCNNGYIFDNNKGCLLKEEGNKNSVPVQSSVTPKVQIKEVVKEVPVYVEVEKKNEDHKKTKIVVPNDDTDPAENIEKDVQEENADSVVQNYNEPKTAFIKKIGNFIKKIFRF